MNDAPSPSTLRPLLSYRQAAAILGMSPATLRSLVARRSIPHVRLAPRSVRFVAADLERWLAEHRVEERRP